MKLSYKVFKPKFKTNNKRKEKILKLINRLVPLKKNIKLSRNPLKNLNLNGMFKNQMSNLQNQSNK